MRRQVAREDKEERELNAGQATTAAVGQALGLLDFGCVSTWTRWRSIKAQRQGQRQGEEERNKERCIRWSRRAASANVVTKLLPDGLVSVGRTVSCPLPSLRRAAVHGRR